MQNITVLNNKYESVNAETVTSINDIVLMRFLGTKNVTHYELENNTVLITPNYNNKFNVGFTHNHFKNKIVYNNAIIYHKTNKNYLDSFGNVRWVNSEVIKTKEWDRLQLIKQYEAQVQIS